MKRFAPVAYILSFLLVFAFQSYGQGQKQIKIPEFVSNATRDDTLAFMSIMDLTLYDDVSYILYNPPGRGAFPSANYYILGYAKGHWNRVWLSTPVFEEGTKPDPSKITIRSYKADHQDYDSIWQKLLKNHLLTMRLVEDSIPAGTDNILSRQ